jgi:glycosyltransferase involved in cell wall biosynthesis
MSRRKLLILGKFYPPVHGGIETHVQDLTQAVSSDYDVRVVVHHTGRETVTETKDGAELVRAGTSMSLMSQPISPDYVRAVRQFEPDLVHLHAPNVWACAALRLAGLRAPLVVTHHCDIVGREPLRSGVMVLYRDLVRRARDVIVTQPNNHTCSADLKGLALRPTVTPYCLEEPAFAREPGFQDEAKALRRERFGDRPVAVFIGRLVPYKGADQMIAALAETPDLGIVIVGDGPLRDVIQAQAERLGVANRLLIIGGVDERTKNLWLAASDFMILPSVTIAEAFGIVQIEAMLWRKPVLTTDLPSGVPQVGVHGETSLVVPPSDVPALAEAMRRLATDATLRERLGAAAQARARELYSVDRFRQNILAVYERALAA